MWVEQLPGTPADHVGSEGPSFNMKQTLWTLALLKIWLDFFHGGTEGDGSWETQGHLSQINLAIPQSPVRGSVKCFSHDPVKQPDFDLQQYLKK